MSVRGPGVGATSHARFGDVGGVGVGWGWVGVGGSRAQSAMLIHVTFKFGIDGSGKGRHCLTL